MGTEESTEVTRWAARAIILGDDGRLLAIRLTMPGRMDRYWVLPLGGIDDTDASPEAAIHRVVMEEFGATVRTIRPQHPHRRLHLSQELLVVLAEPAHLLAG